MSHSDRSLRNGAVIPRIESRLFADHPSARLAVGILAVGDQVTPGCAAEYTAYLRLRARVYADQTHMLDEDAVLPDGTERDDDDGRSIHFGAIENQGSTQRVVASLRLIVKRGEQDRPLPIEDFFPEVFATTPAPPSSIEVSRYICRHEDPAVQAELKWPLYSAGLSRLMADGLGPTYGVVEEFLERDLRINRVPFKPLAPPRFVAEYNAENLGIIIDTGALARLLERRSPGVIASMQAKQGEWSYFGLYVQPRTSDASDR